MAARAILATAFVTLLGAAASAQIPDEQSRREALKHYRAGQEFMAAEKFDRAAEEFTRATQKDHLFTLAFYFLGQAYGNERRYTDAIKAYEDCIDACRAVYALRQTNRFEVDRRRDDDIRELRQSVVLAQRQAQRGAGSRLGLRAIQLEQQLQNLENSRPSIDAPFQAPAEVLLALGSALYHNDEIEQAEFEWLAAIQVNPKLGEAHNNLAVLYLRTGRVRPAADEMRIAEKCGVRVNPQFKKELQTALARR